MQVYKNYNNISETLKKQQRKLKSGESITFQILRGVPNVDPDPEEVKRQPRFYGGVVHIPTKSTIRDPEDSMMKNVAWLRVGENDTVIFPVFQAGINMPNFKLSGRFTLNGDNADHQEILDVISIIDENARNPYRDKSVEPLFSEIIDAEISKNSRNKRGLLKDALDKVYSLTFDEVRDTAAALGFNYNKPEDILRNEVEAFAESEPEDFLKLFDDVLTPVKSDVYKAFSERILEFDNNNGQVKMGSVVLTTLAGYGHPEFDYVLRFSEWINSVQDGKKILGGIKKQLKNKQELTPA